LSCGLLGGGARELRLLEVATAVEIIVGHIRKRRAANDAGRRGGYAELKTLRSPRPADGGSVFRKRGMGLCVLAAA
jgi:hypothetical protein